MIGFRQKPLHPLHRRLRTWLLARLGGRLPRSQRAYVVTIRGRRFKRLVLRDSHHAATLAAHLREFGASGIYPALVMERENELWVEYLEGRRIASPDPEVAEEIARLLAVLHTRAPERVPIARTHFVHALHTDLGFLNQVGVLGDAACRDLDKRADDLAPDAVWVGYDCSDAILKNFLRCEDGRVRCVDVESLGARQLIGVGPAKARLRWLGPHAERFDAELRARGAPDFQSYAPFVELCFLAFWQKSSFLEGKRHLVDARHFDRFRGGGGGG